MLDERVAPLEVGFEQHLGVGLRAKRVAERLELGAQAAIAIDLAVKDDPGLAVGGEERLVGVLGEIDDAQSAEADTHGTIEQQAVGVGATMPNPLERRFVVPVGFRSANESTHAQFSPAIFMCRTVLTLRHARNAGCSRFCPIQSLE